MDVIGKLNWAACTECQHAKEFTKEGCDVPRPEWEAALVVDLDELLCGSFKAKG